MKICSTFVMVARNSCVYYYRQKKTHTGYSSQRYRYGPIAHHVCKSSTNWILYTNRHTHTTYCFNSLHNVLALRTNTQSTQAAMQCDSPKHAHLLGKLFSTRITATLKSAHPQNTRSTARTQHTTTPSFPQPSFFYITYDALYESARKH